MNASYWLNPLIFTVQTLTGLYTFVLILRLLMHWAAADYYNPICQWVVRITQLPLKPMKRLLPPIGRFDTATFILVWVVQMAATASLVILQGGGVAIVPLSIWALADILGVLMDVIFFAVMARAMLSWVNMAYNPAISLLYTLTAPMMRFAQSLLPATGSIDLSPLLLLFAIHMAKLLLIPPLQQLASGLN